jgi:flavin-dependent dehydrogenase
VSTPARLPALKEWACGFFPELRNSGSEPGWRQIAPVSRASISPVALGRIYFVGDSARVVEPFTGEGIAYAIRSGALAAEAILAGNPEWYRSTHRALYRGRLWLNELVKWSCLAPWTATGLMRLAQLLPLLPAALTRKVIS